MKHHKSMEFLSFPNHKTPPHTGKDTLLKNVCRRCGTVMLHILCKGIWVWLKEKHLATPENAFVLLGTNKGFHEMNDAYPIDW